MATPTQIAAMMLLGLPRAAASPVAGYTAWYNPSTIQQTTSVVTGWHDASVNAFHFGTANGSPVYTASAINGLPGMTVVSATQQYLTGTPTLANLIGASSTAFTMYAVYSIASFNGNSSTISAATAPGPFMDSNGFCGFGVSNAAGSVAGAYIQGTADPGGAYFLEQAATTLTTMIVEAYYDGSNIHYRQNGADSSPTAVTGGVPTTGTIQCGKSWSAQYFGGTICELIFYSSVLSSGNRAANHSYLGTKYAGTG
jgi:hypothetical protein